MHLTTIGRTLHEDSKAISTVKRLSRNLQSTDYTGVIGNCILQERAPSLTREALIAIDHSDIAKPYATAMEHLCGTYDGSEGTPSKGYHLLEAAVMLKGEILPLSSSLYSSNEPHYRSPYVVVEQFVDRLYST